MSSKKIGVAVIGTGMAAKPHALALNDLSDIIDVKAIYSRNKDKSFSAKLLSALRNQFGGHKIFKSK